MFGSKHHLPYTREYWWLAIPFLALLSSIGASPNDLNRTTLLCGIDSEFSELLAEAGNRSFAKDERTAIQIYTNLLSIRPNCWDVHTSLALSYAVIGEKKLSDEHVKRGEMLKAQWEVQNPPPRRPPELPKVERKPVTSEPPKTDKINYWKWLLIWSLVSKGGR